LELDGWILRLKKPNHSAMCILRKFDKPFSLKNLTDKSLANFNFLVQQIFGNWRKQ
jgi:hypothetical protein